MNDFHFGERLTELRHGAGMTVQQLSRNSGIIKTSIYRLEKGSVPSPGLITLKALADGLSCPVQFLMYEFGELPDPIVIATAYSKLSETQQYAVRTLINAFREENLKEKNDG